MPAISVEIYAGGPRETFIGGLGLGSFVALLCAPVYWFSLFCYARKVGNEAAKRFAKVAAAWLAGVAFIVVLESLAG